jgi:hypothetical protein
MLAEREQALVAQTAAVQTLQGDLLAKGETLQAKEAAIAAFLQSTSWKVTQPLRVVRRSLGRSGV